MELDERFLPAYELDIQRPWCNDSKNGDMGYPLPSSDRTSSIDIHHLSKHQISSILVCVIMELLLP